MDPAEALFAALQQGDRSALGRAITLVESTRTADQETGRALLRMCKPGDAPTGRIGITGIPGAGKSTLIDALGLLLIDHGHRVAVLAVDPSSARTGGSILGDKTRMERLSQRTEAFIRPTAAAGHLGGAARRTREAILLCEAAGYDRILVETVGTGQNELEADAISDVSVLLMVAGTGDELQGIKRGIMESADIIAFTKCEGAMRAQAERARRELKGALDLMPARPSGKRAEVILTSALEGDGLPELTESLQQLIAEGHSTGYLAHRRKEQAVQWLDHAISDGLRAAFERSGAVAQALPALKQAVRNSEMSPFEAADELLRLFRTDGEPLP